ncbi:MAG: PD40 domain-containing protein [Candidatus Omnitrophica bacterium]|nr:PD40 domain-containing protein [Candidatus Omnitrophota bacterium]
MMMRMLLTGFSLFAMLALTCVLHVCADQRREAQVLPSERVQMEESNGAVLHFITRSNANDANAYFHQRSWLPDESMLFFWSDRTGRREVFGYLEKTGEIVQLQQEGDSHIQQFTAGMHENALYFARDKNVWEWSIDIDFSHSPTRIFVEERCIAEFPQDAGDAMLGINESCGGKGIVVGFNSRGPHANRVIWIDKTSGESREIMAVDYPISHIQCSWKTPGLISFARGYEGSQGDRATNLSEGELRARIHWADLTDREPWPIYPQIEGELVTHECWWVNDQMTFCSGQYHDGAAEQSHVKVYDPRLDRTYIIGPGSWWEGGTPEQVSRVNYWHAAGSPDGRFAAADNWHGIITLFSAKTSRHRILTQDHRTYGRGAHPHVGWSPSSSKLVFASNRYGNPDVCILFLPESWLENSW